MSSYPSQDLCEMRTQNVVDFAGIEAVSVRKDPCFAYDLECEMPVTSSVWAQDALASPLARRVETRTTAEKFAVDPGTECRPNPHSAAASKRCSTARSKNGAKHVPAPSELDSSIDADRRLPAYVSNAKSISHVHRVSLPSAASIQGLVLTIMPTPFVFVSFVTSLLQLQCSCCPGSREMPGSFCKFMHQTASGQSAFPSVAGRGRSRRSRSPGQICIHCGLFRYSPFSSCQHQLCVVFTSSQLPTAQISCSAQSFIRSSGHMQNSRASRHHYPGRSAEQQTGRALHQKEGPLDLEH